MTTHHPEADQEPLAIIKAEVLAVLDDVLADAVLLRAFTAAAPSATRTGTMKVLGHEARAAADLERHNERQAKARRLRCTCKVCREHGEQPGHAWLRRDVVDQARSAVAAPTHTSALSLSQEITRALHEVRIDLTDYDHVFQLLPRDPGVKQLTVAVEHARQLTSAAVEADRQALVRSRSLLRDVDDRARALLESRNERTYLGRRLPCPHCGRHSLVAFWHGGPAGDDFIRCDRVPGAEHYQPCICPFSICECKTRPVAYRHEWSFTAIESSSLSAKGLARAIRSQDPHDLLGVPDPDAEPDPDPQVPNPAKDTR